MLTRNHKNMLASIITKTNVNYTGLPVKATNGNTYYLNAALSGFPQLNPTTTFARSVSAAGIQVGSGNTPASENDYQLDSTITNSSLTGSVNVSRVIEDGKLYIIFDLTITNVSADAIQIHEIGYFQYLSSGTTQAGTSVSSSYCFMLDRTVLDTPVSVPAGDFATIRYKIGCSID